MKWLTTISLVVCLAGCPTVESSTDAPSDADEDVSEERDAVAELPDAVLESDDTAGDTSSPPPQSVKIEPSSPGTNDDLIAVTDVPPDSLLWYRDGEPTRNTAATVNAVETSKGQLWQVVARWGERSAASEVAVGNTPPRCEGAVVTPGAATSSDSLTCAPSMCVDDDDDPITWTCQWLSADAVVATGCEAAPQVRGTSVRCVLTPADSEPGAPVEAEPLQILNSPPTGGAVGLHPAPLDVTATPGCTASGGLDADGDAVSWTLELRVNGVASEAFAKGDTLACVGVPSDGLDFGEPVESPSVTCGDAPATISSVAVEPKSVGRNETVTCTASGYADPDVGDAASISYLWSDGVTVTADFTPTTLLPGAPITCTATPDGGVGVLSDAAVVINYPPALAAVGVGPAAPVASSTLSCAATEVTDPDGDEVSISWGWLKNDLLLKATGQTLSGVFAKGDTVRCRATPTDNWDSGAALESTSILIGNTPPKVFSISISPTGGNSCSAWQCNVAAGDSDADPVSSEVRWEVDGEPASGPANTLPGQVLQCFATAFDGSQSSEEFGSLPVVVGNQPPSLSGATIIPSTPTAGDLLTCLTQGYSDDCSVASVSIAWFDGETPLGTGQTLDTAALAAGTSVRCVATPHDGFVDGPAVTAAPVVLAVAAADAPHVVLVVGESVECLLDKPTPGADGYITLWAVGGGSEKQGPPVRPLSDFTDCDRVRCRAVASVGDVSLSSNVAEALLPVGPDCDDGLPCSVATCAPAGGCAAEWVIGDCDDGDACTGPDACAGGACLGQPVDCEDGNPCTDHSCDGGCIQVANDAPCADGSVCSEGDTCAAKVCAAGTAKVCDDGDPCTLDGCDALAGCTTTPMEAEPCDDGVACTVNDSCLDGQCIGSPLSDAATCDLGGATGVCQSGDCVPNKAPVVANVQLSPEAPIQGQDITCSATVTDTDGPQPATTTFEWHVNTATVESETGAALPGAWVKKGDKIACLVSATDGLATSVPVGAVVTVVNQPPVVGPATVTALGGGPPNADAALFCQVTIEDPDDPLEQLAVTTVWSTSAGPLEASSLSPGLTTDCDAVGCSVTVNDGTDVVESTSPVTVLPVGPDCQSLQCASYACLESGGCVESAPTQGPDSPSDFWAAVGVLPMPFQVELPEEEAEIDIFQGPQGGIHLNIAFQYKPPEALLDKPMAVYVEGETRLGCCDGPVVGSYLHTKHNTFDMGDHWISSGSIPYVFYGAGSDVSPYVGKTACVTLLIGVYEPDGSEIVAWGRAFHIFSLVDDVAEN